MVGEGWVIGGWKGMVGRVEGKGKWRRRVEMSGYRVTVKVERRRGKLSTSQIIYFRSISVLTESYKRH